ncbi:PREDICTED: transcription factor GTE12 isoform X2 [Tarenaya hassleriana]|uniref:transcription factor GTE12 isoform X2 n=1 Tax=Tarenaya hassleriana TaxID=28532 RepID=UPI00053C623E|nr:PREDICTED: transcription factor GTE12 isoform X2 [Tarenaya hassleriana]
MGGLRKLRIKFRSEGAERSFHKVAIINGCSHKEKKTEQPAGEDISSANRSRKRGPEELDEFQTRKKQKLVRNVFHQCSLLLKSIKEHRFGWVFAKPVDPVKLNIPDYFSVIPKPMDFSTIECKLAKNGYNSKEEFAADVRLTFSNAMLYNPPENMVHRMAKELNEIFALRWKLLQRKRNTKLFEVEVDSPGQSRHQTVASPRISPVSSSKPVEEKARKVPLLSKLVEEKAKKASHSVSPTDIATKPDQGQFATRLIVEHQSKVANGCGQHDLANGAPNFSARKCGSCGNTACICLKISTPSKNCPELDNTLARSCRDKESEAFSVAECQEKSTSDSQPSKSDPHSDGWVSSMEEENGCQSSQLQKPSDGLSSDIDLKTTTDGAPLSPKALRAAMLRCRFSDTIMKAKQRKALANGCSSTDLIKLQQERERLERMQQEEKARMEAEKARIEAEKARIEADVRAAEASTRKKKETELKMEREKQRLALQKMEEAAKIEEEHNRRVEREMEKLMSSTFPRLLEKLGLFMKEDDIEPDLSVLVVDLEEGEIL